MRRESRIAGLALASLGVASVLVLMAWGDGTSADALTSRTPAPSSVALAVLGDSNSHSYQDYVWFPAASNERGGTRRARTFQWTEVLARMRGQELDLGPWKKWGRPGVVARAREFLGMDGGRAPKKEDYLFNFANSGASCKNLMGGRFRQAPRLVELMDRSPERWKNGVVVIRIGLNNWQGLLDVQAQDPNSAQSQAAIDYCSEQIGDAIALIRKSHPT
ncbi:MAG: SGNH/GDSL hydrolase family protein, partial [Gammaproteobacteria bacterium]|nr:SGNH/GDSL hydrolase family protein [Gammaproteobacteria bacterium]